MARPARAAGTSPKFFTIDENAAADHPVVAAVDGRRIRVLSYMLHVDGNTVVEWRTDGVKIFGAMTMGSPQHDQISAAGSLLGAFETGEGEALSLN